jgi:hypothetical protein
MYYKRVANIGFLNGRGQFLDRLDKRGFKSSHSTPSYTTKYINVFIAL